MIIMLVACVAGKKAALWTWHRKQSARDQKDEEAKLKYQQKLQKKRDGGKKPGRRKGIGSRP
jgi:hypothetical protein